jgi:TP901 family phage tail tape measure protein
VVDAQANIRVNLDAAQALAELKALEKQIQVFNKGIVQGTAQAAKFQNEFATSLIHNINATGKFTASMGMVHTETERFSHALEKNQLSAREYFRYSMASTKSFGKLFGKEFGTITKTAEERVKLLQTRHIELGRAADGAMRAVKIVPTSLDYKQPITQMQMAIQKQQIFNQLLDTGTTKLLNFGKNTQWAGRQLMVGFTIPLTILGGAAIRTFREMETQAIRFKKVYGDMFTAEGETDKALENIQKLGQEFTKYGIKVSETIRLAADAAAAGNTGKQLEDIVEQTTKLAVLGDLTSDQAFDATIAIQNAFRLTGKELEDAVNFLNAVENQTVVALEDITEAIPRVASVVSVLGGDIEDLAVYMAAMKEGGIQAADGANALKTSLGRLINPTKAAVEMSANLGINLKAIVDENAGDLSTIMLTFAEALKPLDDLSKARLMEKVFGKFQFARMTTLFNNLGKSGTQAARAMDIAGQSTESLAMLAEKELGTVADSAATKFAASMEKLKVSLAPLGEELIKLITPVADFFTKLLGKFNDLSDGSKKVITGILVGLGAIGPVVLMGIGLFANGIANLLKFVNLLRKSYQSLTMGGQALGMSTNYLSTEQLEALSVANNLHRVHERLTDRFALEAGALAILSSRYREATMAAAGFLGASGTKGMFVPGTKARFGAAAPKTPPIPMADGGFVPGTGNKDTVPAMLMPGEFVVTKKATKANAQTLKEMNNGGGTFRNAGTPAFGKMEFREEGTVRTKNPQTQTTQGTRALAHVGVRTTIYNNEVKELLRLDANDTQKLGGVARERLQLLDKSQNLPNKVELSTSELKRIAKDVTDQKNIKASQIDVMERDELKKTIATNSTYAKLNNDKQILSTYGKKVNGYTSQVVDMDNKIQSGMTARGKNSLPTTTRAEIVKDIKSNRFTFALGLQQGVLDNLVDDNGKSLTQKEKTEISRNIAKKTERALVRGFGANKIVPEDDFTKIYNKAEQTTLDEKFKNKSITFKNKLKADLDKYRKTTTSLRVAGKDVSSLYLKGTGPLSYKQFDDAKTYRQRVFANLNKVDRFNDYVAKKTANVSSKVPSKVSKIIPSGRFGARAAMGTGVAALGAFGLAAAAQAFENRSLGTPAYGEPRATQAMLTPGEFVVNAKSAQKFGPALQSMNEGGVVYRQTPPNIPGYVERPSGLVVPASSVSQPNPQPVIAQTTKAQLKLTQALNKAKVEITKFGSSALQGAKSFDEFRTQQTGLTKEERKRIREDKRKEKEAARLYKNDPNNPKVARKQRIADKAGKAGMIGFVVSMGAMGVSSATEGKTSENAANVSQVAGGLAMFAYMLPMLMNPLGLAITGIIGIAGSVMLYNNLMKKAADDGYRISQSLGVTADEIKKVSESTGQIALSQIGQRMREDRQRQFTPINADFGTEYIDSDAGKMMLDQIKEFEKQGIDSSREISKKLATFVADGLMTAAQAEGVISELGRQMGSTSFAIKLSGQLQDIIGFNGENLKIDPMTVRVRIVEEVEASTSGFIASTQKDLDEVMQGAAFYAVEEAQAAGKGPLGQMMASITAVFRPKLLQNELAGAIAGQSDLLLESTQQQIDAGKVAHELKKTELDDNEKILRAQLSATNNVKDREKIELELLKVLDQRAYQEESYAENNKKLLDKQRKNYSDMAQDFNEIDEKSQRTLLGVTTRNIRKEFKGSAEEGTLNKVLDTTAKFTDKTLTYRINTLISSDQLSVTNASKLVEMFTDEGVLNEEVESMINVQGLEAVNRTLDNLSKVEDEDVAAKLFSGMSELDPAGFEAASIFLETAVGIPTKFSDIFADATTGLLTPEQMKLAGEDLEKIKDQLKDLEKFSGEERITKIMDFVTSDDDFAVLQGEAEYFGSLDDVNVKQFLSVFTVIKEDFDPEQARLDYMQSGGTTQGFINLVETKGLQSWWTKNIAVPRSKELQRLIDEIKPPKLEGQDDPNGQGSSLPITVQQLMELRMKGLDPAAASSLNFEAAAKILNGTVKQQKKAISLLNEELRESSIRTQLLKTDEQVLEDTLKSTTSAISAYISMLEQTRIKPIQDQIDAFNDLTDAQSEQIEKYQKGLQSLSDKEDSINKVYNERIDAIDKVTEANDRSAQRQQRQIDLASAIASGDFGAAASAAAEITNAESQAQLEDTKTALEQQQQSELAALVVEVNGQLYTREQIETNIKSLEESIYQTTLLIKQEQEKIANIEKTITAEKEKQRKLQVLTQMSELSTQMQSTVNQSARQAMGAQLGYLGQSIGLDPNSSESIAAMSQSLGINVQSLSDSILKSQQIANLTANEFAAEAEKTKKKVGDLSRFFGEASVEGKNSLGFLTNLSSAWAGDSKKSGLGGMVSTGRDILSSLSQSADAIRIGKIQIQNAVDGALASIRAAASVTPKGKYNPITKKWETAAFGGVVRYMGGGKVNKYAMGGNVNYKGSTEPAPVRMAVGNIVPGLGNTDRVPALLTPGEFVVRKSVTKQNLGLLKSLNGDVFPQMSGGIGANVVMVPITNTNMEGSTTLYNNNYSVNVNVGGTNSTADEVANVVIRKIKGINDRGIRGSRY